MTRTAGCLPSPVGSATTPLPPSPNVTVVNPFDAGVGVVGEGVEPPHARVATMKVIATSTRMARIIYGQSLKCQCGGGASVAALLTRPPPAPSPATSSRPAVCPAVVSPL